jgi:hypothetical protein
MCNFIFPSRCILKYKKKSQVCWCISVIPATQVGELRSKTGSYQKHDILLKKKKKSKSRKDWRCSPVLLSSMLSTTRKKGRKEGREGRERRKEKRKRNT